MQQEIRRNFELFDFLLMGHEKNIFYKEVAIRSKVKRLLKREMKGLLTKDEEAVITMYLGLNDRVECSPNEITERLHLQRWRTEQLLKSAGEKIRWHWRGMHKKHDIVNLKLDLHMVRQLHYLGIDTISDLRTAIKESWFPHYSNLTESRIESLNQRIKEWDNQGAVLYRSGFGG